jgi:hypothetical protein
MNTPSGYIQDNYTVQESACEFVQDQLSDYNEETSHFFKHVLISSALNHEDHYWVPVCSRLIEKELRGANPLSLVGSLLKKRSYNRYKGLSRRWKVVDGVRRRFCLLLAEGPDEDRYDLFTGSKTERQYKSSKYDDNRNPHPDLIQDVMDVLNDGYFNKDAVRDHLETYEEQVEELEAKTDATQPGSSEHEATTRQLKTVRARWDSDLMCWNAVLNQDPEEVKEPICQYRLAYEPQKTGRITQIAGGLQNGSVEMKEAAYSGFDSLYNYDIKASQAFVFRDFMQEAGLDTSFLDTYLSDPDGKYIYSDKVGITAGTWKSALYAICMGAYVPKDITRSNGDLRTIFEKELREKDGNVEAEKLETIYARFRDLTANFLEQVDAWKDHLINSWIPSRSYQGNGHHWLENDVGCTFKLPSKKSGRSWLPELIAFLLQGREAYFIHELTVAASRKGITVISNEHDGLVTLDEVPDSIVDKVRRRTGMDYIRLPEKSFT